jgi:hypothetical protein
MFSVHYPQMLSERSPDGAAAKSGTALSIEAAPPRVSLALNPGYGASSATRRCSSSARVRRGANSLFNRELSGNF